MISESALQEDVDVVGLSILSGAHMTLVPRLMELFKMNEQEDVLLFIGGIIPEEDIPRLLEIGVAGVYGPGTNTDSIVNDIRRAVLSESD
jgi:methylmalonyl-CoA mutase C-terminal domain/subunit